MKGCGTLDRCLLTLHSSFDFCDFVLGMYLAKCYKLNSEIVNLLNFKILVPVCILCVAFTGVAGLKGGIWKLYNDIPSMIGY